MAIRSINKIEVSKTNGNNTTETEYSVLTPFDKVYLKNQNNLINYTLKNFYDDIIDFFSQPMHMICSKNEPSNQKIVEWYQISSDD